MADVSLAWGAVNGRGDWRIADGDTVSGNDLQRAILIALSTDARASDDFTPAGADLRGWWADTCELSPLGSRLCQLEHAVNGTQPVLSAAKRYCEEALRWLIGDGIASAVTVRTQRHRQVGGLAGADRAR